MGFLNPRSRSNWSNGSNINRNSNNSLKANGLKKREDSYHRDENMNGMNIIKKESKDKYSSGEDQKTH